MEELKESYPTRDYNRVISSRPSLLNHYPKSINNLGRYIHNHVESLISKEREKIKAELDDVEGFLEVKKRKKKLRNDLEIL
jgi:hypothetical protein